MKFSSINDIGQSSYIKLLIKIKNNIIPNKERCFIFSHVNNIIDIKNNKLPCNINKISAFCEITAQF